LISIVFNISAVIYYLLILVRVASIVFILPVFGANILPTPWKIAFSVMLAVITFLMIPPDSSIDFEPTALNLIAAATREVLIGLLIGISAGLIFSGVLLGGQVIGTQMGLAISNIFDPQHQTNVSIVASFHYLFATVLFLAADGHHLVLYGIRDAFIFFPVGQLTMPFDGMMTLVNMAGKVFVIAVQLASALIVMLLLVSASLGLISRTVPQMNIFIVGFPLQLLVGLFGLGVTIPFITKALLKLFQHVPDDMLRVLERL